MNEPTVRVTMRHVRAAHFCASGMRAFLTHHGLDVSTFISEGLPVELLQATGDALAHIVCKIARDEANHG